MHRLLIILLLATTAAAQETTIQVPENRAIKNGRTIPIRVLVIPAESANKKVDPMFALTGGGPGIASIPDAKSWVANFPDIAATRDVVFFDMRGTGASNALDCPMGEDANRAFLAGQIPVEKIAPCRDALAQKAELKSYTTADAADDMEDIRRALGYERINIYGSSYTARLAMVYAQRYPKRVRTVTMKAVTPFALRNPLYFAASAQAALDRVFADCAADATCREKYPDLKTQFASIHHEFFAGAVRRMLYSADTQRALPLMIASAAKGDFAPLQPMMNAGAAIDRVLNLGLFLSVTCAEDVSRFTEREAIDAARNTFSGPALPLALLRVCREWPAAPLRHAINKKARVPALIISGTLDPDTPPRWGEEMKRLFPGSTHMVVEGMAHSGSPQCVRDAVTKFVLSGKANGLGAACEGEKRPAFR
ncbi:MAG TPA: alpha/beta hydrolase [Thermoanaerobaculia bacterium]|nr:alpha/beta hydrolase [Thermoanaerobaculia bacterium]